MIAIILALAALLLLAATEYLAWDARKLEAPVEGAYSDAQAWADDLDSSLNPAVDHECTMVLVSHGVVSDPWVMPPALALALASVHAPPLLAAA